MAIDQIIREKRKALGLTQEQVAQRLGVSTPAVNKWEKGKAQPDIMLLAPLARLLQTDVNTLLCFKEELTEQEVMQFCNELTEKIQQEGFEMGLAMAKQKIAEYPSNDKLIHSIALMLDGAMIMVGMQTEEKEKYAQDIESLYERLTESENKEIHDGAVFMLASKYCMAGRFDRAQEMIDLLPQRSALDKEVLQANLYQQQGEYVLAERIHEKKLLQKFTQCWNHLLSMLELESRRQRPERMEQIMQVCSAAAELFQMPAYYSITPKLMAAVELKKEEASLELMEQMLDSSNADFTSYLDGFLFDEIVENKEQFAENRAKKAGEMPSILPAIVAEMQSSEKYDFLKENERYQKIIGSVS